MRARRDDLHRHERAAQCRAYASSVPKCIFELLKMRDKGVSATRLRVDLEVGGSDHTECPEAAYEKLHQVVASHVLHDSPTTLRDQAICRDELQANAVITSTSISRLERTMCVGREDSADRRLRGQHGIDWKELASFGEDILQSGECHPCAHTDRQIARIVVMHRVELRDIKPYVLNLRCP